MVVPLNPGAAPEDWTYILEHSEASGVAVAAELRARLPAAVRPGFLLEVEEVLTLPGEAPGAAGSLAEAMAVVLYTSGTTGAP